jgi:hypothetical protein
MQNLPQWIFVLQIRPQSEVPPDFAARTRSESGFTLYRLYEFIEDLDLSSRARDLGGV